MAVDASVLKEKLINELGATYVVRVHRYIKNSCNNNYYRK